MLGWLQGMVGVMLPTFVAGCTAPPVARGPVLPLAQLLGLLEEAEVEPGSPCTPLRQRAVGDAGSKAQLVAAAAGCTLWRLDAALRDCCRGAGSSLAVAVTLGAACCLLAGNLYALTRAPAALRALGAAEEGLRIKAS